MQHRVAMVGAGYFARFQLEGWRDCGVGVVAVCDTDRQRAQFLAQEFGVPMVFNDAHKLLETVRPTLLDVVLPPAAQSGVVTAALERGIATICQKPFGIDLDQAQAMAALARQQQVMLAVHENFRFTPWFRECRRLIDAGFFGRLHGISFRLRPGDGQGPNAYLDRQPYFQTMPQLLVRETAVHFIDTFRYLMGEVRSVTAWLRRLNPAIAAEDAGIIVFEFDDDRSGLFDGNRLNDHAAANTRLTMGEMWLEGERGVMRLNGDASLWWKPHNGRETEHVYAHQAPGAFGGACTALQSHVLAHLQHGSALENSAEDYLANLRVQAAIYHSHHTGRRVAMAQFDPHHHRDTTLVFQP